MLIIIDCCFVAFFFYYYFHELNMNPLNMCAVLALHCVRTWIVETGYAIVWNIYLFIIFFFLVQIRSLAASYRIRSCYKVVLWQEYFHIFSSAIQLTKKKSRCITAHILFTGMEWNSRQIAATPTKTNFMFFDAACCFVTAAERHHTDEVCVCAFAEERAHLPARISIRLLSSLGRNPIRRSSIEWVWDFCTANDWSQFSVQILAMR